MGTGMSNKPDRSNPGLLLVIDVRLAELRLQDPTLFTATEYLQGDEYREDEKEPRSAGPDDQAQDEEGAEDVNWIADARVEAGCDQLRSLGGDTERSSQLNPGNEQKPKADGGDQKADDALGSPRHLGSMPCEAHRKYQDDRKRGDVEPQSCPPVSAVTG